MRIALVRGGNLNPWELANFDLPGHEIVAFGSRSGSFEAHGLPLTAHRLPSPDDAVRRLPALGQGALRRFTGDIDYLVGLERALRGFDVAHVAELATAYSHQALRARERGAVSRVVATVWDNIALPARENGFVERRVHAVALGLDRCLAISERARLHLVLAGVPDERIDVIPMGVDLERFTPSDTIQRADGSLRVLCVSRLVAEKGVEDLVVAMRLLADRGVPARLTLVGEGPLRGRLQAMAAQLGIDDRVDVAGTIPYEQLPSVHRAHDVFVLASGPRTTWQEQFGFAVVEAMASGLPVVAGDSGSLDEVVGDRAQLVTPHHPPALAGALGELADPTRRRELGAANRRRAEERYDRREVARRISAFYERALAAPPRASSASSASSRSPIARQS
jgi:phosphatidyl-myo-inositol dimannoside synthase